MEDDLTAFYDVANGDAELVTVAGASVAALFEVFSSIAIGEQLVSGPTLRLPARAGLVEGAVCAVRGVAYRVRRVMALPPDGREQLLVLAQG